MPREFTDHVKLIIEAVLLGSQHKYDDATSNGFLLTVESRRFLPLTTIGVAGFAVKHMSANFRPSQEQKIQLLEHCEIHPRLPFLTIDRPMAAALLVLDGWPKDTLLDRPHDYYLERAYRTHLALAGEAFSRIKSSYTWEEIYDFMVLDMEREVRAGVIPLKPAPRYSSNLL